MKKSLISRFIVAVILISASMTAHAQNALTTNTLLYHSFRNPQSNKENPAFWCRNTNGYLSLPQFGFNFGFPVSYKEVGLTYDKANDVTHLNINHLTDILSEDNNVFHFNSDIDLLGLGFQAGNLFITLSSSLHLSTSVCVPTDAFKVISNIRGNNWIGQDNAAIVASKDLATANVYGRLSLGGGYTLQSIPLTIGLHANLLDGVANVNTDETNIAIYATDDYYSTVVADIDYRLQQAGCVDFDSNFNVTYTGVPKNLGFSFDLGAKYEMGNWTFSASIIDIGPGIHWKDNVVTTHPRDGHITFSGFDISNMIEEGTFDSSFVFEYKDSVVNQIKPIEEERGDYWYAIPTKLNIGASYTFLNKMMRAGFLFHGEWEKGLLCPGQGFVKNNRFRFNSTLSLNASLYDWVDVMVGNSLVFDGGAADFLNPGAGIIITPLTFFQVYVVADYISDFYLVDAKSFNCKIGINLLFN